MPTFFDILNDNREVLDSYMKILVCEDQSQMRKLITKFLKNEGYVVFEASNGEQALEKFYENSIDLVVLDWMLPKLSGIDVMKQMKQERKIKIIILTAKSLPEDEVKALMVGADDYIAKPFHAEVLLARVSKLLGNVLKNPSSRIQFFPDEYRVTYDDKEIDLTKKEYELFYYFYQNEDVALTRDEILLSVWGMDNENDGRTVDSFVRTLREKTSKDIIKTVYGIGYKFEISK